jgi:hypothetical protein
LYAPDGKLIKAEKFKTYGLTQRSFAVKKDGMTGTYTLIIMLKNPWLWTLQYLPFKLDAGKHALSVVSRYDRMLADKFCFAPMGKFNPVSGEEPPREAIFIEAESGNIPDNYLVLSEKSASGGKAIRKLKGKTPVNYEFEVSESGDYCFYSKIFKGAADLLQISVDGGKPVVCSQTHDMTANSFTSWALSSSLGEKSIIPTWRYGRTKYNSSPIFNSMALKPSPAFANAVKYVKDNKRESE